MWALRADSLPYCANHASRAYTIWGQTIQELRVELAGQSTHSDLDWLDATRPWSKLVVDSQVARSDGEPREHLVRVVAVRPVEAVAPRVGPLTYLGNNVDQCR